MTPMINHVVRAAGRHAQLRCVADVGPKTARELVKLIDGAKPFLISKPTENFSRLTDDHPTYTEESAGVFSPAPRAWIEFDAEEAEDAGRIRSAVLLEGTMPVMTGLLFMQFSTGVIVLVDRFEIRTAVICGDSEITFENLDQETAGPMGTRIELALLLINMPVGLKVTVEAAHRANVRAMQSITGSRPNMSYSTIALDPWAVAEPNAPGIPTGRRRAFHFCRSHIRQRQTGAVELVRAHWRGDQALGRVESRYEIAAPGVR